MLAVERRIRFLNPVNFADQSPKAFRGDPFPETIWIFGVFSGWDGAGAKELLE
jgi:hypothetical protein